MKGERTDKLRRRPVAVRYFFLAVSKSNLHTGLSYGGLNYVNKTHGIESLYLADLLTQKIIPITEPIVDFMARWRAYYNKPEWDYEKELAANVSVPKF